MRRRHDRKYVRTFFSSSTAVEGKDDSARTLKKAA
jgi:bifunctional (S)-malyl-CoA lyase/thioesterase